MNNMRKILFKAKRLDTGEWVEGYYQKRYDTKNDEQHFIFWLKSYTVWEYAEIDPNTLCQYTGLNDKSGKRIWENDILCGYLDDEYPEDRTLEKVIWNTGGFYTKEKCSIDTELLDEWDTEHFETCGNIFDNPELLEVE